MTAPTAAWPSRPSRGTAPSSSPTTSPCPGTAGSSWPSAARRWPTGVAQRAVDLLSAEPVPGGTYRVVADQKLAGVFIHEAFGHLSEADFIHENPRLREVMVLGRRFGPEGLTVIDNGDMPGLSGYIPVDDEGVLPRGTRAHHERPPERAAPLPRDGGENGRGAGRQRPGHQRPEPADRAHDQHLHRERIGHAGRPAPGRPATASTRPASSAARRTSRCSPSPPGAGMR